MMDAATSIVPMVTRSVGPKAALSGLNTAKISSTVNRMRGSVRSSRSQPAAASHVIDSCLDVLEVLERVRVVDQHDQCRLVRRNSRRSRSSITISHDSNKVERSGEGVEHSP